MQPPRLTKLEMQIMDALWNGGTLCIRDIQESFPEAGRPAYSTVQTTVYRLEEKGAVRRARKIGNAHLFEAVLARGDARGKLIDELLGLFGGRTQPVMAHLVESGQLTMRDIRDAEKLIEKKYGKEKPE